MKLIASLLAAAVLSATSIAAHATTIAPGVTLGLANGTTNYTLVQTVPGTFSFSDSLQSITAVYTSVPGLLDAFVVTDVCLSTGIITPACKAYTLTIGDANAAGISIGVGADIALQANTTLSTNLVTVKNSTSVGAAVETINFALPSTPSGPGTSPVPEPGTLSLMATGLIGAAGAIRRKYMA